MASAHRSAIREATLATQVMEYVTENPPVLWVFSYP
nr:MAG TPA: hypothetical protein [Caudoviricetes sp.]